MRTFLATLTLGLGLTLSAQAVPIDIVSNEADGSATREVAAPNTLDTRNTGSSSSRTGALSGEGNALIVPFDLPDVDPLDITAASLTLNYSVRGAGGFGDDPTYNVDLYGLARTNADPTILGTDYFEGTLDGANTLLEDSFLVPTNDGSTPATFDQAELLTFIQSQYAAFGAGHDFSGDDDFIFLRVSPDTAMVDENSGYLFKMNHPDNNPVDGPDVRPLLTLDVIPEPASLALMGLGGLCLIARRRHG